jgi:two-component system OmpR family response regulator
MNEMAPPITVLAADDDPHIREVLRFTLENGGYTAILAGDGKEALEAFASHSPTVVILDIVMPEMNGVDVCKEIRKNSGAPVIFLTSKDDEIDRVVGLEIGADDYITKPFSPRELLARIRAILRRIVSHATPPEWARGNEDPSDTMIHGALSMNMESFKAYWLDQEVSLTPTEFSILKALLKYPGKVFTRDELMDRAYPGGEIVSDRTIDSHVRRVRKKFSDIGGEPVETVHGLGYRLGDC